VLRGGLCVSTVLIYGHRLGKVPVQFLALAVVAKAENNQNCLNSPGVLVRLDLLRLRIRKILLFHFVEPPLSVS
jgi:hypothetical protein